MKNHILFLCIVAVTLSLAVSVCASTGLLTYGEEANNPRYRIVDGSDIGSEQSAVSVGGQADWVELAANLDSEEMVMITLDESNDVNVQVWDGDSWGNQQELTTASRNSYNAIEVAYESQSGDAMVVYADVTGTNSEDKYPRYNIWNGSSWSSQGQASYIAGKPNSFALASNPNSDELIMVTNDGFSDINAQVWDGSSWGSVTELTATSYSGGQPFDAAYESQSGDGLIVYTNTDGSDTRIHYRIVTNGTIGSEQHGTTLGDYGRMYRLIPDPDSDEIILMVLDYDKDTRILVWDGSSWSDKGEVSENAQSTLYMSLAGAYESDSGDAVLVYSDNTNTPKYRTWDGSNLSSESSAPACQNIVRWMEIAANPDSDGLTLITNTYLGHIDALYWDGSSWTKTTITTSDTTGTRGGVAVAYEQSQPPDSCSDTDGGNVITIFGTTSGYYLGESYSNDDYCVNIQYLMEYYCSGDYEQSQEQSCGTDGYTGDNYCYDGDVYRNYTDYFCSGGECTFNVTGVLQQDCTAGQYCENGECKWSDSCNDTDGGNVIDVFGTTSGYLNNNSYSNDDYCLNSSSIMEYYCSGDYEQSQEQSCGTDWYVGNSYCINDSVYMDWRDYYCSSGECDYTDTPTLQEECEWGCTNGTCDLPPDSCNDTDGGWNEFVQGTASGYYVGDPYNYTDFCADNITLIEYYCYMDYAYNTTIMCTGNLTGCSSGACY